MRTSTARAVAAAAAGFLVGVAGMTAVLEAPSASAFWTDTGVVTSGPVTTWGLTNVTCPNPTPGALTVLSWTVPTGSTSTVTLDVSPDPGQVFGVGSYWTTAAPREGTPLTTTGTSASWGIGTNNPAELTTFTGTWTLVSVPPAPTGGWSATRAGTWTIAYTSALLGVPTCSVNP